MATRTGRGCWTCRARRKRCDAQTPRCETCTRLGIECAGYDAQKPVWFDGGAMQQAYCRRVSVAIKGRKRSRGSSQTGAQVPISPADTSWSFTESSTPREPFSFFSDPPLDLNDAGFSTPFCPSLDWTEDTHDAEDTIITIPNEILDAEAPLPTPEIDNVIAPVSHTGSDMTHETVPYIQQSSDAQIVDHLIMHYFDYAFHDVFPCHCQGDSRGFRVSLFSWSTISEAFKNSILSVSALHLEQYRTIESDTFMSQVVAQSGSWREYYRQAIAQHRLEMESISNSLSSSRRDASASSHVVALACVVHLIWIARVEALVDVAQVLLQDAMYLIAEIDSVYHRQDKAISIEPTLSIPSNNDQLLPGESEALRMLTNIVGSDEILWHSLSSDSLGRRKNLTMLMQKLGSSSSTPSNRVLLSIKRITDLRSWKQGALNEGRLNVLELSRHALIIERDLKEDLLRLQQRTQPAVNYDAESCRHATSPNVCQRHSNLRLASARLLALTAQIYLHIVVSGANQALPEIKDRVMLCNAEMQTLKACSARRIDLAWPKCVLECVRRCSQGGDINGFTKQSESQLMAADLPWFNKMLEIMKEAWGFSQ